MSGQYRFHPTDSCGLPSPRDQRRELAERWRVVDLEDHDVTIGHHYELDAGFQVEAPASFLGDDDLAH
jgi:hypothetical protein